MSKMSRVPRVVIESPYTATDEYSVSDNEHLARSACRHAVQSGFNPYASHLFYTQFLNDNIQEERLAGIEFGIDWGGFADEVWMCLRPGEEMSRGMAFGFSRYSDIGLPIYLLRFYPDGERVIGPSERLYPLEED